MQLFMGGTLSSTRNMRMGYELRFCEIILHKLNMEFKRIASQAKIFRVTIALQEAIFEGN